MINEMPGQGSSVGVSTFYPDDCDSVSGEELGDVAVAVAGGGKGIGGEVFTSLGHDGHGVGIGVGIDAGYGPAISMAGEGMIFTGFLKSLVRVLVRNANAR